MIILGVDPGTIITGYGVIETRKGVAKMLTCGAITNADRQPMPIRLKKIYDALRAIIRDYKPDEFAIETAFYGKNAQSALKLGQARGVAMLAAVTADLPVMEYSPREVKKAIVGNGTASKQQVQYMIQSILKLEKVPDKFDVTDALAVAVCHLHRMSKPGNKTYSGWKAFVTAHPEKVRKT
jgi:crossover junction endodeoxyribonuclease RuvC